ncbi:uncharacterized protein FYW49_000105 [Xenentodon cancila]
MKVLWTSLLLISSITCAPQGGNDPTWLYSALARPDPAKPFYEKPTGQASGSGTLSSSGPYYSGSTNTAGGAGSSGYGLQSGQSSGPGSQQQVTEESWTSSDGQEPVFTPVTDEDQVIQGVVSPTGHICSLLDEHLSSQPMRNPLDKPVILVFTAATQDFTTVAPLVLGCNSPLEPVFTPVTDEDQVYAYKTRSRYNRKDLGFSQFHYTQTEPLHPQEPAFPYPSKTSQHSKGGF